MNKLVLSFMCKNESHIILDMLNSTLPIMDALVCMDTGSTDNTVNIVKKFCIEKNIPYIIHNRAFDNFKDSRNALMEYTLSYINDNNYDVNKTYWFSIDCDDIFIIDNFDKEKLVHDYYSIGVRTNGIVYLKKTFFKGMKIGIWEGVVHEDFIVSENYNGSYLDNISIEVRHFGNSWSGSLHNKYKKQALLYENIILEDSNPRFYFYIGETYLLAGGEENYKRAIDFFSKRTTMSGDIEQIYYSHVQIGLLSIYLGYDWNKCMASFLKAYSILPSRAESIREIVKYYNSIGEYNISYLFNKMIYDNCSGKSPYPNLSLYIYEALYDYLIAMDHVYICYKCNKYDEMLQAHQYLLSIKDKLPLDKKEIIDNNDLIFKKITM